MRIENGKQQSKNTMWFKGQNVPILYGSDRKGIFGSESWFAKGTIQRIGATVFASVCFGCAAALFVSLRRLGAEVMGDVGGLSGQIFATALVACALAMACTCLFLTFRLTRGIVRSFDK
jgi:hypothetical protein